jgi:Acetyltransferase (GNAT) family.
MLENDIIGFGRVIGDGGIYLYIQDVIVLPEFQGQGIRKYIMNAIKDYLNIHNLNIHTFPGTFVDLMAAKEASRYL